MANLERCVSLQDLDLSYNEVAALWKFNLGIIRIVI